MGEPITFAAAEGSCPGWLARPAQAQGARGLLVLQEWWGLNDDIKSVAERFAGEGLLALAPDLYHGVLAKSPDEAQRLLMDLDLPRAERDLRGAVEHLRAATGRPVGSVGFCMGGALSLFAACRNGAAIGACVVYYGGYRKVSYDWDGLTAPVLGHWAEHDAHVNERLPELQAELERRGRGFEFHHYAGAKHAFFNSSGANYDRAAAELSFARTLAFLRRHL